MTKIIIALIVVWLIHRFFSTNNDKVIMKKDTKIDFNKVKDAEFEDNE
jgi:hypothetical protein